MHPFPNAAVPVRGPAGPYMAQPAPTIPLKAHKATVVRGARVPVAQGIPGRPTQRTPQPVPPPVAAAPTPTTSKIQPQLQMLPRFRPPRFEGANGVLPTPESPGSTPRDDAGDGAAEDVHDDATLERSGPYAVGSVVEYRSRSSGQWIVAKVEGFDEANNTYRLDVQPHANPERVRIRGGSAPPMTTVQNPTSGPAYDDADVVEVHVVPQQQETPPKPVPREADIISPYTDVKDLHVRRSSGSVITTAACQAAEPTVPQLMAEVEALRSHIVQLQVENQQLTEQVVLEVGLKERYYNELCALHEQQRANYSAN